jgi:phosphoenolpyruvate carboxykinase (ATP)
MASVSPAFPDLAALGLRYTGPVHVGLSSPALVEAALARQEGQLTDCGALVALTGARTGRSPKDKYLVADPAVRDQLWWTGNQPLEPASFDRLWDRVRAYLQGRELFLFDGCAGADPNHCLPIRVIANKAWHALFAACLFRPVPPVGTPVLQPLTIVAVPDMRADPALDGTRTETFVVLNLTRRLVLIGNTHYAGEIKKSAFSFLNYLLPQRGVFPMHCSANIGPAGDTALFFGLSGTGKTTLSADPERRLIGDDEHGWSDKGVFNIEGGCYAKTIRLSQVGEPQIWNAIRYGSVLENVVVDPLTRQANYDDTRYTENTRAAYPASFIANAEPSGRGGHPRTVVFLTCDAFGVLPPLARLTAEQALYHFLSGYTAKVAGTEAGVTEPEATFSTCFAAPFLPLHPAHYAGMLHERLRQHGSAVWLVNTGWSGGPFGIGKRIPLAHTRAMLRAVLAGTLNNVPCTPDPVFGVQVPTAVPDVPTELLRPRATWRDGAAYDARAHHVASLFRANFEKYADEVSEEVRQAGPRGQA